jgi:hypothetical protein
MTHPLPLPPLSFRERQVNVEDVHVPEFHLLVNYPGYLARGRSGTNQDGSSSTCGKRHCVMCGKLRICSSSTLVGRGSTKRSALVESQAESTTHIIPRQNKGVCTACDVAVWVVLNQPPSEQRGEGEGDEQAEEINQDQDGQLEIKWCKGCKNFRPWPAFGDKVLATKCVRCRERQKEKYATQKVAISKTEADVFAADVLGTLSRAKDKH